MEETRFKKARKVANLTQDDIYYKINIPRNIIHEMDHGIWTPSKALEDLIIARIEDIESQVDRTFYYDTCRRNKINHHINHLICLERKNIPIDADSFDTDI
jgi:DNA-binding XRE family transcriptional regulator